MGAHRSTSATKEWPEFVAWPLINPADCTVFVHKNPYGEHRESDLKWSEAFAALHARLHELEPAVPDTEAKKSPARRHRISAAEKLSFRLLDHKRTFQARALVCLAARGESVSISLRKVEDDRGEKPEGDKEVPPSDLAKWGERPIRSTYMPDRKVRADYWFTLGNQCDVLAGTIFGALTEKKNGLVVLTGATKSAKTEIAYGLTHLYLEAQKAASDRRPHLVTFEDPIERFFAEAMRPDDVRKAVHCAKPSKGSFDPDEYQKFMNRVPKTVLARWYGIDYTPRERGTDVHDLGQAFADALRQTPAVFYIGEVRDPADWPAILAFAGTGHLVITTAHAGSLLESMTKILAAVGARTPADRRQWASKILAAVHLRSFSKKEAGGRDLLLPAVWRGTAQGLASLSADGLGALVPNYPFKGPTEGQVSCLGRRYLLDRLWQEAKHDDGGAWRLVNEVAMRSDLGGV
jgi:hypothetical protein